MSIMDWSDLDRQNLDRVCAKGHKSFKRVLTELLVRYYEN